MKQLQLIFLFMSINFISESEIGERKMEMFPLYGWEKHVAGPV